MSKRKNNLYRASDVRRLMKTQRKRDLLRAWNIFVRVLIPVIWIYIAVLLTIKL